MKKIHSRGFTLLETLVAVTILAFAVAGPLYAANRAFVAAQVSRDQLIASHLAQEGVEYVRAMRDNKYLEAYRTGSTASCAWTTGSTVSCAAWTNFLTGSDVNGIAACVGGTCTIEPGYAPEACSGSSCKVLRYADYGGTSIYTTRTDLVGINSPFTRTMTIRNITSPTPEVVASSTVRWSYRGTTYSVSSAVHLTPWQ